MGIFDRFRKGGVEPPESSGPAVPANGEIVAYDHAAQIGSITLDSGEEVAFTLQECVDFHPNIGAPVVVEELAGRRSDYHATRVVLGDESRELEAIHAALVGGGSGDKPDFAADPDEALARGAATVLLSRPLRTRKSVRQWVEACAPSAELRFEPDVSLDFEGLETSLLVGTTPLPTTSLDLSQCDSGFVPGDGFVTVVLPTEVPEEHDRDPWGPDGWMRALTRLLALLSRASTGVVIHQAGHYVHTAQQWRSQLSRPIEPWTRLTIVGRGDTLALVGLGIVGLPDIETVVEGATAEQEQLSRSALIVAAHQMVHDRRVFSFRDTVTVPRDAEPSDLPNTNEESSAAVFEVVYADATRIAVARIS